MARKPTEALPDGMRQCKGSAKFGIDAHVAPLADFASQPSQRDGLAPMCRPDWARYTKALREAAAARGDAWALPKPKAELVPATPAAAAALGEPVRLPASAAEEETPEGQAALEAAAKAARAAARAAARDADRAARLEARRAAAVTTDDAARARKARKAKPATQAVSGFGVPTPELEAVEA